MKWSVVDGDENIAEFIPGFDESGFCCLVMPTAKGTATIRVKDKNSDTYLDIQMTVY